MKLQLALDMLTTKDALNMISQTIEYIDIIEIGTPLIKHEGIKVLKEVKKEFPKKRVLVDLKTMDVGEYESNFCFEEGADIVTVLGVADINTIKGSIKSAAKYNKKVVIDLINLKDKESIVNLFKDYKEVYFGVHTGIDQQQNGQSPLKDLKLLSKFDISIFVAGGINLNNLDDIIHCNPYSIVVGGAITNSSSPAEIAKEIKSKISQG